ncbi:cobyrinate a,c-diamide synthase [Rhizobium sp. PAMB 3174]
MSGFLIAAPSSGAGKTTVTLGLLRALRRRGVAVKPGKAGPDYIDPAFHAAACSEACFNFDPWAMRPALLRAQAARLRAGGALLVVEAMMGLYDGAADGSGSPADLAALLGLPVLLVVDCARMSHSVAALVRGFSSHRGDIHVAGLILNRVGSDRHEAMLRDALSASGLPILAVIRQDAGLALPERHLGLVQAGEHAGLEAFIERAADAVESAFDFEALDGLATAGPNSTTAVAAEPLAPLGQIIAVARDMAFAFSYEHMLAGWRDAGAEIRFFSPLADEAPSAEADAVYLPGGYPELHASTLTSASVFRQGMLATAARGAGIYGECGGYMVLGEGLIDAAGSRHAMLGLLPLVTSFAERKRHLGYRRATPLAGAPFDRPMTAHEFHYSTVVSEGDAGRLFRVSDALGADLGEAGLVRGNVCGSYIHLIDLAGESR